MKSCLSAILVLPLAFSLISCRLSAQTYADSSLTGRPIQSIQIYGNTRTRPEVILREMTLHTGDPLSPDQLETDRKQIENLLLFNRVQIFTEPRNRGVALVIWVTEQWYLLPYPVLHINERDWKKISYGAGLMHLNFRGRAENINARFKLGYNPLVDLGYYNPWLGGRRNLIMHITTAAKKVRSKHFGDRDIDERHLEFNWIIGKRFGLHFYTHIGLGYEQLTYDPVSAGKTLLSSGCDRLIHLYLYAIWDYRDLKTYPHRGWYLLWEGRKTGIPSYTIDYWKTSIDARKYFPVPGAATLALRLTGTLSSGTLPVYDRVYLGYSERIRGHFFETMEGENRMLASAAFRFPLLPVQYFSASERAALSNLRFGISASLFVDSGTVWFTGQSETITEETVWTGFGGGLHFHLPYNTLFRLELGFNEDLQTQVIADLYVDI